MVIERNGTLPFRPVLRNPFLASNDNLPYQIHFQRAALFQLLMV